jgi:hypothetical protein
VGLVLRLLPGLPSERAYRRHGGDLDQARADFEEAWRVFLSHRTEADFQEWRAHRAFTAWKYRMWDTGYRLPTQSTDGRSKCFCGAGLTIGGVPDHVRSVHLETA